MNKKIFFLVLFQICLFAKVLLAQQPNCTGTTNTCLSTATQHIGNGHGWLASHGGAASPIPYVAPTIATNSPNSPSTTEALTLWALLNGGTGAFTCYDFRKDSTYKVCFWVRNTSGWPTNIFGRLHVYAANNILDTNRINFPSYPSKQLIDNSYVQSSTYVNGSAHNGDVWEFVSATFTPHQNFTSLWFTPINVWGVPPPNMANPPASLYYSVEVDNIRVENITSVVAPNFSVLASKDTIGGCGDSATLRIKDDTANIGSSYIAKWTPSASITPNNNNRTDVVAKPCSTTTYKIEIIDSTEAGHCTNCVKETIYYTVNVNQWGDSANIVYPPIVPCLDTINLDYNDPGTCPGVTYSWIDPQNNIYTGKPQTIFPTNALMTGEWTLRIWIPGKSCFEEHKFFIAVGSCCISRPSFTWVDSPNCSNPVQFINTSTGITSHTATLWSFGDGTSSSLLNPTHTYNVMNDTPMLVCLTMIYEDDQGESCCERVCAVVEVCGGGCAVVANYTDTPVMGTTNEFDFYSNSTFSTPPAPNTSHICGYSWDFGNGVTYQSVSPHMYYPFPASNPGPWYVCMTVTNCIYDPQGNIIDHCTDTKCRWIYPPQTMPAPGIEEPAQETQPKPGASPIIENNQDNTLAVYPNPNKGNFTLSLDSRKGSYNVSVRDKLGREVYKRKHKFNNTPIKLTLNDVANGIYTVEVENDNEKFVQQISITK